jgi:predicted chitinase
MPPADLNGLVRFAERLNMVSTRVPSHFKRSLPQAPYDKPQAAQKQPTTKNFNGK